jgi:hypothetical protein
MLLVVTLSRDCATPILGAPQVLEKIAILKYEKMTSKIDVMHDITHTSLSSKALVMWDTKCWSYLYSSYQDISPPSRWKISFQLSR